MPPDKSIRTCESFFSVVWKAQPHEYAAKREVVSRPRCSSGSWTSSGSIPLIGGGWKWSLMVCLCILEFSLPLTPLWLVLCGDGTARRGVAVTDGVALAAARRRKERRYPELVGPGARSRLVVLGVEVGGRWSAKRLASWALWQRRNPVALLAQEGGVAPPMGIDFVMRGSACCGIFLIGTPTCVQTSLA